MAFFLMELICCCVIWEGWGAVEWEVEVGCGGFEAVEVHVEEAYAGRVA